MTKINQQGDTYKRLLEFRDDARNVKTAHFIAAQRKQRYHQILGISIVLINILIFSPFISLIVKYYFSSNQELNTIIVKALAILSASLASVQTLLNSQKKADTHLAAGEAYTRIYQKSRTILAKFKDSLIDKKQFIKEINCLEKEYLEANNNYKLCIPSDSDYDKANQKLLKRKASNEKALDKVKK